MLSRIRGQLVPGDGYMHDLGPWEESLDYRQKQLPDCPDCSQRLQTMFTSDGEDCGRRGCVCGSVFRVDLDFREHLVLRRERFQPHNLYDRSLD